MTLLLILYVAEWKKELPPTFQLFFSHLFWTKEHHVKLQSILIAEQAL